MKTQVVLKIAFGLVCLLPCKWALAGAGAALGKTTKLAKRFKGTTFSVGWTVGNYLLSPEDVTLESIADDTLDTLSLKLGNETADCDTVQCSNFMKECTQTIGLPKNARQSDVKSDPNFKMCLKNFFMVPWDPESKRLVGNACRKKPSYQEPIQQMSGCPLDVQTRFREDANLDRILSELSPPIRNLSCEKSSAQIEIFRKGSESYHQNILFTSKGLVERVDREPNKDGSIDRLVFDAGKTQLLQHCDKNSHCENYPIQEVLSTKLYFWNEKKVHEAVGDKKGGIPREAFEWARKLNQTVSFQAAQIRDCCHDNKCQDFFAERTRVARRAQSNKIDTKSAK